MSLRLRLLLLLGTGVCIVWLLAAVWLARDLDRELGKTLDQRLAASARMVASLVEQTPESAWSDLDGPVLSAPAAEGIACRISTLEGTVIAHTANAGDGSASAPAAGFAYQTEDGTRWRTFTHRTDDLVITTSDRVDMRRQLIENVLLVAAIPFLIALIANGGALLWGIRRGLAPLEALRRAVGSREPDSLSPVDTQRLPAELTPLGRTLNDLLKRMDSALRRERRFTDDAAHELRTPVASIKTNLDVARRSEGERADVALGHAVESTDRLAATIDQLLTLARLDSERLSATSERATSAEVIERINGSLSREDRARLTVRGDASQETIAAPVELLSVAVGNAVTNALRHTKPGTPVMLETRQIGNAVRFEVDDTGPGVAPEDLDRLTERFWRNGVAGGSGLGLAIAAAIAERFEGAIDITNRTPHGLRVRLSFPIVTG
ncbi:HAMP domain-containing histidine kinase [Halofilum ochraceum]|uniref:HAMP domain-containing histidine kinase n=1 Tax=Halofilum ochraceum TaxID=1611323 RepID=UPI0008350425|nr:HAMP domain-containing histidine kinase [Halofilum ochraceum]